jgi:hypothetical protein
MYSSSLQDSNPQFHHSDNAPVYTQRLGNVIVFLHFAPNLEASPRQRPKRRNSRAQQCGLIVRR